MSDDGGNFMERLFCITEKIDINKKIVIFGTGNHAKEMFAKLLHYGIKIDYFADRNDKVIGLKLYGIEIVSEESLKNLDCQIIIASAAWKEIEKRLVAIGKHEIFVDTGCFLGMSIEL